jgi:hypothetical protein
MTRAHLIPETIGGFLWARTQCATCNSELGADVEGAVKRDDGIRLAIEALAERLPDLARSFREGQRYAKRTEQGIVRAKIKDGLVEVTPSENEDGSLFQSPERARQSIGTILRREGRKPEEVEQLLAVFDEAPPGSGTPLTGSLSIRHGSVEGFDLPFDGEPVSDAFPASIGFHFLALAFGRAIYHDSFDGLRKMIRSGNARSEWHIVEGGRGDEYAPFHLVGLAQTTPHLVVRVQLFGWLIWRVHFAFAASSVAPGGIYLDLTTKTLRPAAPTPMTAPLDMPERS